ncbi:heterogeneous nuclear ribonucleoprotein A1 [Ditylenchus destructor]|nr:heterogeneous nuclear ribonucleoprotein A1 [Ditylenchus destructor]
MLLECHTCAKEGTKTTFETLDELKGHICGMHCGNIAAYLFMCQHCQHICESEVALLKHTKMCKSRPRNVETVKKLNRQLDMYKLIENSVQQSMAKSRQFSADTESKSPPHQHRNTYSSPDAAATHLPNISQESVPNIPDNPSETEHSEYTQSLPESSGVTRRIKSEPLECPQTSTPVSNNGGPAVNGIRENTETGSDSNSTSNIPNNPSKINIAESSRIIERVKSEPIECVQDSNFRQENSNVNGISKTTEPSSISTSVAIEQRDSVTPIKSEGQACSASATVNSSVKIEPADLNNMDTSEVEVLGEVHVRKRKRQSQPSDLATKSKSKPQEIPETNDEDIVIIGQKEVLPKTKPTKKKVTFLEPQVHSDGDRNLRRIGFGNNGFVNPGVPSSAIATVSSASMSKKSKKNMDSKRTVAIYGTNSSFSKKMLKAFYSQFGDVVSVKIFQKKEKKKIICNAYITFATEHQCNKVIESGPKLHNGLILRPAKPTDPPPPHPQIPNTPLLSATRIRVKGICVRTSTERKLAKTYLRSYFEVFGAIEDIVFDMGPSMVNICFKSAATADLCLQQNNHIIFGNVCEVKRTKATKAERRQLIEAMLKNVPTPQDQPESSTATARATLGDRECRVTRSSVPKSTTLSKKNQKKKVPTPALAPVPPYPWQQNTGVRNLETSDPRLPYHAGLQPRNEMPTVMPLNAVNFNANLNYYHPHGPHSYEESWGQSTSFSYPTYSGSHLPYNSSLPLHYEMPTHGPAMLSYHGNDNQAPPPGPSTISAASIRLEAEAGITHLITIVIYLPYNSTSFIGPAFAGPPS